MTQDETDLEIFMSDALSDAETGRRSEIEPEPEPGPTDDLCHCDLCTGLTDGEALDGGKVG